MILVGMTFLPVLLVIESLSPIATKTFLEVVTVVLLFFVALVY